MRPLSHSVEPPPEEAGASAGGSRPPEKQPAAAAHGALVGTAPNGATGFLLLGDLTIPLPVDRETVVGRDHVLCDVVLPDSRVSKVHLSVFYAGDRFFAKDLGSLNGTRINGVRLAEAQPLVEGDDINLPPYRLTFAGPDHSRTAKTGGTREEEPPRAPSGHFTGQLNILSISDLIQLLNSTKQSGLLKVVDDGNQGAVVAFHHGEIVQADYCGVRGEDAVYMLLTQTEGQFEFIQGAPPPPQDPVRKATVTLLLDGCRLLDEGAGVADTREVPTIRITDSPDPDAASDLFDMARL